MYDSLSKVLDAVLSIGVAFDEISWRYYKSRARADNVHTSCLFIAHHLHEKHASKNNF